MIKSVSILLAVCIILALPISAFAASSDEPIVIRPFYTHIGVLSAGLSIDGSGRATSGGIVQTMAANTTLSLTVSLQQYKDGEWKEIKSWTTSGPGNLGLDLSKDHYVSSGYSYRVVVTAKVLDSSSKVLEEQSKTTTEKKY